MKTETSKMATSALVSSDTCYVIEDPVYKVDEHVYKLQEQSYALPIEFATSKHSIYPLFRYIGSKKKLLVDTTGIYQYFTKCSCYVVPFVGSGSDYCYMYNHGLFKSAIINDNDHDLVDIYLALRDHPADLIGELSNLLKHYPSDGDGNTRRDYVYTITRPYYDDGVTGIKRTAMFYILRNNWFGGIHKGNSSTLHSLSANGPHDNIRHQNIINWSAALANTDICFGNYDKIDVPESSFVYVDPPYYEESGESRQGYGLEFANSEQEICIDWCKSLAKAGSRVVFSNSSHPKIVELLEGVASIKYLNIYYSLSKRSDQEIIAVFYNANERL